jgi:hypothetical protein
MSLRAESGPSYKLREPQACKSCYVAVSMSAILNLKGLKHHDGSQDGFLSPLKQNEKQGNMIPSKSNGQDITFLSLDNQPTELLVVRRVCLYCPSIVEAGRADCTECLSGDGFIL